jgi:hypothetical protein
MEGHADYDERSSADSQGKFHLQLHMPVKGIERLRKG